MGARSDGPPIDLTDSGILTDVDGTFAFDTLEETDYRLVVSSTNFATYQELRIRPSSDSLSIQLSDGAAISGSVLDAETSAPIIGAIVTVNDVADVKKSAVTDGNGRYYVRGVTEQRRPIAYVSVTATGFMRSGNVQVEVTDGAESTGQDFYLERNGVVRGVVLDANGSPLQGVSVSAKKQHSEQNPVTVNAAPEVVLMMLPLPCASMCGAACRMKLKLPFRWVSMVRSQPSSSSSREMKTSSGTRTPILRNVSGDFSIASEAVSSIGRGWSDAMKSTAP
jgi:hypothetical protein